MDRISDLPDGILCNIVSFLSTKEAGLTSSLSKRWKDLFAFTTKLRFEDHANVSDSNTSKSFTDFVDRVLEVSGHFPVKELYVNSIEAAHINRWICKVLSHGVLEVLTLDISSLPFLVFACKTLVKLRLGRDFVIPVVPKNASFPSLKILSLDHVYFYKDSFKAILSACHVLEELMICGPVWKDWERCYILSLLSPTLQRLTIQDCVPQYGHDYFITLNTPRLTYLEYNSWVPDEFQIVNFDSLVVAKLTLYGRLFSNNPTNLIKGLKNIEILDLRSYTTCEIFKSFGEEIPVLENLTYLSIQTKYEYWMFLPLLLKKSPNLQKLCIKGTFRDYDYDYDDIGV